MNIKTIYGRKVGEVIHSDESSHPNYLVSPDSIPVVDNTPCWFQITKVEEGWKILRALKDVQTYLQES